MFKTLDECQNISEKGNLLGQSKSDSPFCIFVYNDSAALQKINYQS